MSNQDMTPKNPASSPSSTPAPLRPSPLVDVVALRQLLDGAQAPVRDRVRSLLRGPEFAYLYGASQDEYRDRVFRWLGILTQERIGALGVPKQYGGAGDMQAFLAAFETLAFHDLSLTIKFGVQFGLFQGSILNLGTKWHHEHFLPRTARGELLGVFAMTELGHGSNVRDLETTATWDADAGEFVIQTPHPGAHKEWLGNAARDGRMATVFAQLIVGDTNHGVHALLVPIREPDGTPCPGICLGDTGLKEGLNGVDNGRIWFDQVRVPREYLLDRFGGVNAKGQYVSPIESPSRRFFTMIGTLVGGRISLALSAISVSKTALTIAIRYGNRRRQFGRPGEPETQLLDYLTHQRRLLIPLATAVVLDLALSDLVDRYLVASKESESREVEGLAAGLKAYASWMAQHCVTDAREACGGQGYRSANRIAVLRADIDVWTTFEGDNTVLMQLLAKALLSGYRSDFNEMGAVRIMARKARAAIRMRNPVTSRRDDEDHLRDPAAQRELLAYREQRLLDAAGRRLRARLKGEEATTAFNSIQDHLLQLARAHVELVAFDAVQSAIAGDSANAALLALLRDTFWADCIERDLGWYLMSGAVETPKAKAIRYLLNKCVQEMRPIAEQITEAFAIPDEVLAAPIAFNPLPTD